jgi:hypothetical protein
LHSTDIAFKPTEDGWGYNPRYSSSWDRIFAKKNSAKEQSADDDEAEPAANEPSAAAAAAANPVADDPILNELRNRIVALPAARRRLLLDSIEAS